MLITQPGLVTPEQSNGDPTDDKSNRRFFSLFKYLFGITYNAVTDAIAFAGDVTIGGNLALALGKVQKYKTGSNPSAGVAVLVAGTVTVATTAVLTGDKIRLTRQVTGGTVGHLTVGTITNATSFVINASVNTDTSTVLWEIVRPY